MSKSLRSCIYCQKAFDPSLGAGDHVLPSALFGEFKDDKRFRGACSRCNNECGKFEQVLAQSSPLGFYRRLVNPNRGSRAKRGTTQQGARGNPAPKTTSLIDDCQILVQHDPIDPMSVNIVDQLIVTSKGRGVFHIRLHQDMTEATIRGRINSLLSDDVTEIAFHCEDSLSLRLLPILRERFPDWSFEEKAGMEPGNYSIKSTTRYQFSTEYFQALAKIGLHYYLAHNRRGYQGSELAFDGIRRFIMNGGESDLFFVASKPHIALPFAGPGFIPPPITIALGDVQGRIILPVGVFGHVFQYERERLDHYAGRMIEASISRLR